MTKWAEHLDMKPEINWAPGWWDVGYLGRWVYVDEMGGRHARWEAEDGEGARGEGVAPPAVERLTDWPDFWKRFWAREVAEGRAIAAAGHVAVGQTAKADVAAPAVELAETTATGISVPRTIAPFTPGVSGDSPFGRGEELVPVGSKV